MKAFVITLTNMPESVAVAERCIESGRKFGVEVERVCAFTPADLASMPPITRDLTPFTKNRYSRPGPCMAAFASHRMLWTACAMQGEPFLILEHDAVFVAPLPDLSNIRHCCNLGHPSFGAFRVPAFGIGPLKSKAFLPGAHAYYITPKFGGILLEKARTEAQPTDVFIHTKRFPGMIQEAYPWPVECHESFSTIQGPAGCAAKHRPVQII